MNPLPLVGIVIGILILRPLKGGGLLIRGLHYYTKMGNVFWVKIFNSYGGVQGLRFRAWSQGAASCDGWCQGERRSSFLLIPNGGGC